MAKKDTVAAIKAANSIELDENNYSQKELDQLLALSGAGQQANFDALRKQFDEDDQKPDDNTKEAPVAENASTKSVKVNYAQGKVSEGAGFIHPESKQLITGDQVVSVPADEWTDTMIREKTLTEVRS